MDILIQGGANFIPTTILSIVPVTLDSITDNQSSVISQPQARVPSCMIKVAGVEISIFNGKRQIPSTIPFLILMENSRI